MFEGKLLREIVVCTLIAGMTCASCIAQSRTVALTFDDIPAALVATAPGVFQNLQGADGALDAERINRAIVDSLDEHHAPATAFVNGKRLQAIGDMPGQRILRYWVQHGYDLGNHTFSHADLNRLTVEQFQNEVVRGETSIRQALAEHGKSLRYLRFPYNHAGDTKEKHDAVAAFLSQSNYTVATCTIDNLDYAFSRAYDIMLARKDHNAARKLRAEYLAFTSAAIDYYSQLHKKVFGREIPHVMLLHANRLNADMIGKVLGIFEQKQYRFVTLDEAQSDPAYRTPDTFITKYGPMWGYRWARELGVEVNGKLEPEPPEWILNYSKASKR